jgi:LmbE family N-acetylglucosaminyl deacetylase
MSDAAVAADALDGIERVLVVTAHPDDVDFGAAGSVARWTNAGVEVAYCICTSGEAGGSDPTMPRSTMAEIREAEQRAAAKVVGVTDVTFLGHPDGRLQPTLELRRDISRVIRRFRPQRVLTQAPERNYQRIYASHPDHLAAGEAALAAVYPDARNPFAHPELLDEGWEPWSVREIYLMISDECDTFVETTDVLDRKVEALRSHVSQHAEPERLDALLRDWAAANARSVGLPDGTLAELFRRVDTR